jgi:hypothetical protein
MGQCGGRCNRVGVGRGADGALAAVVLEARPQS